MDKKSLKDTIFTVATFVIAAVLLVYIVIQLVAPDLTIKVFRFKPYVVVTQSMEPIINQYDVVIAKNFDLEDLEAGDIITFYADVDFDGDNDDIVTHYINSITEVDGEYFIRTNPHFENEEDIQIDYWLIRGDEVLGLYNFRIPWVGYLAEFVKSPFGIAAIVVNVGVIGGIIYLIKHSEKKEEAKDDKEATEE